MTSTEITFNDNGLSGAPQPITISLSDFLHNNGDTDGDNRPLYSLSKDGPCYGLAITGANGLPSGAAPVSLTADPNSEPNEIQDGSETRPTPTSINLTVGNQYVLYEYVYKDGNPPAILTKMPPFTATSSTMTLSPTQVQSSDTIVFRCVPA
jgi:hypothetical protein